MARVLVIDDDPSVRDNLVAFLEDEGVEVCAAGDEAEALRLVAEERPDLAIVDMRLPGGDGNELISRAHEICPEMTYLVHTGSADYTLPQELRDIGITEADIQKKPVADMAVFMAAIRRKAGAP